MLLLLACLSTPLAAQVGSIQRPPSAKSNPAAKSVNGGAEKGFDVEQVQALDILNGLFDVADDIKDAQVKIKVQGRIADALWDHDEARARRLFIKAFKAIDSIKEDNSTNGLQYMKDLSTPFQLRREVIRLASSRDPALADSLIKSISKETQKAEIDSSLFRNTDQAALYLEAAMSLAGSDPQRAADMIKLSLNDGMTPKLVGALRVIRGKTPALADEVFSYAMFRVQRDPAHYSMNINLMASYLFPHYGQSLDIYGSDMYAVPAADQADPALIAQFLNASYQMLMEEISLMQKSAAINKTPPDLSKASVSYATSQMILPYFDQFMPDKASLIRAAAAQLAAFVPHEQVDSINTFTQVNSVDDLISKAERAKPDSLKDAIYAQAGLLASRSGRTDQGLSIIEKIKDRQLRADFDSMIRFNAATSALAKDELEVAHRFALGVSNPQLGSRLLSQIAWRIFNKGKDVQRATEVLTEARRTLEGKTNSPEKIAALLILTDTAARMDSFLGFDFIKSVVQALNNTEINLQRLDELSVNGRPSITAILATNLGVNNFNFDAPFSALSKVDYVQALQFARSISMKEASILAQLAVCRGVLSKSRGTAAPETGKPGKDNPKAKDNPKSAPKPDR
jgi:hypothetical protein